MYFNLKYIFKNNFKTTINIYFLLVFEENEKKSSANSELNEDVETEKDQILNMFSIKKNSKWRKFEN